MQLMLKTNKTMNSLVLLLKISVYLTYLYENIALPVWTKKIRMLLSIFFFFLQLQR